MTPYGRDLSEGLVTPSSQAGIAATFNISDSTFHNFVGAQTGGSITQTSNVSLPEMPPELREFLESSPPGRNVLQSLEDELARPAPRKSRLATIAETVRHLLEAGGVATIVVDHGHAWLSGFQHAISALH